MSSSNLPSLVLDNCLKIDRIVYSELQMNRWLQTVRLISEKLATTYRIPLAYSHTVFQYAIRGDPFWLKYCSASLELAFAWNQQFKVGSFAFGALKLGMDFPHAL